VIKQPHIQHFQQLLKLFSQPDIAVAGFRLPAGVVVDKDDCGGVMFQHTLDNFAGVNGTIMRDVYNQTPSEFAAGWRKGNSEREGSDSLVSNPGSRSPSLCKSR